MSYSPARRNPERYKEILESTKTGKSNEKQPRKPTGPVVKLQSDNESSEENGAAVKVDEFLIDKHQDKELNRLKALKNELAAKVKESLEKKIISEAAASSSKEDPRPKSSDAQPENKKPEKERKASPAVAAAVRGTKNESGKARKKSRSRSKSSKR